MEKVLIQLFGSSWKTSLIGFIQFVAVTSFELLGKGETNWKHILGSAVLLFLARHSADSSKVKEIKKELDTK